MEGCINSIAVIRNIVLWFSSLLLGVSLFSLIYGPAAFIFVFRITITFALPAAFLYLPFVIAFRDAEDGRLWTILGTGILIGPATLIFLGLILHLIGGNARFEWQGDGIAPGLAACLAFALVVGCLTTAFYVIALKVLYRWLR